MGDVALNKIVAVEKGVKSETYRKFTDLHKRLQKNNLLSGIARTYRPKDEDGDTLPPEQTQVQLRAEEAIEHAIEYLTRLFDVVATKDYGNTEACADVTVDGEVLVKGAPVTYLLFLEKQLSDLKDFIDKLPALDASEQWEYDPNQACFATRPVETHRTKKVPRVLVKYEATDKHPAQTEVWYEDIIVGTWETVKFSGALPTQRIKQLQERVRKLTQSVKYAREEANAKEVAQRKVGEQLLKWIFRA